MQLSLLTALFLCCCPPCPHRLSAAVSHLERIVARPTTTQPATNSAAHTAITSRVDTQQQQQQQQQQGVMPRPQQHQPNVIAAAVVEASCAAHRQWQEEWRCKWQHALLQQPARQQDAAQQQDEAVQLQSNPHLLPLLLRQQQQHVQASLAVQEPPADVPRVPPATPPAAGSHHDQSLPVSSDGGGVIRAKPVRRPPRLPAFMQHELQQQLGRDSSSASPTQQPQQQQPAPHRMPAPELQGALAGSSTGVWVPGARPLLTHGGLISDSLRPPSLAADSTCWEPRTQPTTPATQPSPTSAATSNAAAASRHALAAGDAGSSVPLSSSSVPAASSVLAWQSPQVGRRRRLQPRQLRSSLLDTSGAEPDSHCSSWPPGPDSQTLLQRRQQLSPQLHLVQERPDTWAAAPAGLIAASPAGMAAWQLGAAPGVGASPVEGQQREAAPPVSHDLQSSEAQVLVLHHTGGEASPPRECLTLTEQQDGRGQPLEQHRGEEPGVHQHSPADPR